jgi:hypothetical protein
VLQVAIVHERERLAVARAVEEHQPAERAGLHTVLVLRVAAVRADGKVHDVRLQPHGVIAAARALDGAEAVVGIGPIAGYIGIDARPVDGFALDKRGERGFLHLDAFAHVEHLGDDFVVDHQHGGTFAGAALCGPGCVERVPIQRFNRRRPPRP